MTDNHKSQLQKEKGVMIPDKFYVIFLVICQINDSSHMILLSSFKKILLCDFSA
jgi:hypothetical protein